MKLVTGVFCLTLHTGDVQQIRIHGLVDMSKTLAIKIGVNSRLNAESTNTGTPFPKWPTMVC